MDRATDIHGDIIWELNHPSTFLMIIYVLEKA